MLPTSFGPPSACPTTRNPHRKWGVPGGHQKQAQTEMKPKRLPGRSWGKMVPNQFQMSVLEDFSESLPGSGFGSPGLHADAPTYHPYLPLFMGVLPLGVGVSATHLPRQRNWFTLNFTRNSHYAWEFRVVQKIVLLKSTFKINMNSRIK